MKWGFLTQSPLIVNSPVIRFSKCCSESRRVLSTEAERMSYSLDVSKPWQFSDVVLVVEKDRFHVHLNILGMWSDWVFTTMFTSGFKEKYSGEVPLPGKKSSEIKQMLLVIYPTSAKPISQENYGFLLDLAKEYMMRNLKSKCETFLMKVLEKLPHATHHSTVTRSSSIVWIF